MTTPKKPPRNAQPCESLGETYWLSEITPGIRKLYSSLVRARARQELIDDEPLLAPEAYAKEWKRLQDRIDSGAYQWNPPVEMGGAGAGAAIRAAFDTTEGTLQLIQMLLMETHGEINLKKIGEIVDGNPEGINAAMRAASGLPPLAESPAETKPGTAEASETPVSSPGGNAS